MKNKMTAVLAKDGAWVFGKKEIPDTSELCSLGLIRVRVMLAGLCRTDIAAMEGKITLPNNRVLGHEGTGYVEYIPPKIKPLAARRGIRVGSIVAIFPFIPCHECDLMEIEECMHSKALGLDRDGLFSEFVDLPLSVLFSPPPTLSWKQLAYAEPVAASMAVTTIPELRLGRVGILGSGRIATLTKEALTVYRGSGDDVPIFSKKVEGSFDALIETKASAVLLEEGLRALRPGGLMVIKSRPQNGVIWPHALITMRRLRLQGAPYGSFAQGLQWMSMKKINVSSALGEVFPWSKTGIKMALRREADGQEKAGKLFFNIGGISESLLDDPA